MDLEIMSRHQVRNIAKTISSKLMFLLCFTVEDLFFGFVFLVSLGSKWNGGICVWMYLLRHARKLTYIR